jgi:hypothetical protein
MRPAAGVAPLSAPLLGASLVLLVSPGRAPAAAPDCVPAGAVVGREETIAVGLPGGEAAPVVLRAKVDTGADRTTIHAAPIRTFRAGGRTIVSFVLAGDPARPAFEAPLVRTVTVKSSNGARESRPVVALALCLGGRRHAVEASLTDRATQRLPVLIGRDLLEAGLLVDVRATDRQGPPACAGAPAAPK